jgi:hypothetical protein
MNRKFLSVLVGALVAGAGIPAQAQDDADRMNASMPKVATKPLAKPGITAEQRAMLVEKLAIVGRLMQAAGADRVGSELTPERQRWMLESMYRLPLATLRGMATSGSPDLLSNEIAKATRTAKTASKLEGPSFGTAGSELVYLPQAPCRWIDTRNVGGPLVGTRQFDMDADGTSYGGAAGCVANGGIGSANVAAVAMNVAIVAPTAAPGFIGARPVGSTATTSLVNWYQAGPSVQASNAGIVTNDQGAPVNDIEFFGSPTQFIVDVFGVFGSPTATALDCTSVQSSNFTLAAGTGGSVTSPACPTGYTPTGGSCTGGSVSTYNVTGQPSGNGWFCYSFNTGASSSYVRAETLCCRVPGR